jgi:hypothetical protein
MRAVASLGIIVSLLTAHGANCQESNAPAQLVRANELAALQRGTLEVWVPQDVVMGRMGEPNVRVTVTYKWPTLLDDFKRDFPDFDLRFKILGRDDFARAFHSTERNPVYPDVAFLDNRSERGPLMKNDAVISMLGRSRFDYNGWWTILRGTKNLEAGRALMLWLSQSPHWQPWKARTAAMPPEDAAAVQSIAKEAVRSYEYTDAHSLSSLTDQEASHFNWESPPVRTIAGMDRLMIFGNSSLAFVLLSTVSEAENAFGMSHSALVIRKVDDRWKVLLILRESLPHLEALLKSFDNLGLRDGQAESPIPKVTLMKPADHAQIPRFPQFDLEWESLDTRVAAYLIEYQLGQPEREFWSISNIKFMRAPLGQFSITTKIPFGIGHQPHRWRIWAIGGTGAVSTSDWRTVDFTN